MLAWLCSTPQALYIPALGWSMERRWRTEGARRELADRHHQLTTATASCLKTFLKIRATSMMSW